MDPPVPFFLAFLRRIRGPWPLGPEATALQARHCRAAFAAFDPALLAQAVREATEDPGGPNEGPSPFHRLNLFVALHTAGILEDGGYATGGRWVPVPPPATLRTAAVWPVAEPPGGGPPAGAGAQVVRGDCLLVARKLRAAGWRVAVLNMACDGHFGGGFTSGHGAQEETLFRSSDYVRWKKVATRHYPLSGKALHTPGVTVFRGPASEGYPLLDAPFDVTMVAVAAVDFSHGAQGLTPDRSGLSDQGRRTYRARVLTALAAAAAAGCDAFVLGALGCGAFRTPPAAAAGVWAEALGTGAAPPLAVFAVLEDHNSGLAHNPQGNAWPFARALGLASVPRVSDWQAPAAPTRPKRP